MQTKIIAARRFWLKISHTNNDFDKNRLQYNEDIEAVSSNFYAGCNYYSYCMKAGLLIATPETRVASLQRLENMTPREYLEIKSLLTEIRDKVTELVDASYKELLTPAEVCKILKIGRTTYQRYIDMGLFDQVRLDKGRNSKVYVKRSAIQKLIDEGKL